MIYVTIREKQMSDLKTVTHLALLGILLLCVFIGGCSSSSSSSGETATPAPSSLASTAPQKTDVVSTEPVIVTIGNLTDKSGVAAIPMSYIDLAVQDMIDFYNEENLIPGVELKLIEYDTQYNPGRFVSGYEMLREQGADLIWNSLPPGVTELRERADEDGFCIFSATANVDPQALEGSYVFCIAITPKYEAYTCLDWIAKNDSNFPRNRPAKIGGAAWREDYSNIWFDSAKAYCEANPDKYQWVNGYLTGVKFSWQAEVEGLKDCDYIYIPTPPQNFAKEYREAGYEAKFIGTELHVAFNGMIDKSGLWDEFDGMLLILAAGWYNDENDATVEMINSLLKSNYAEARINEILTNGAAYRSSLRIHMICDIIRQTVAEVGAENFSTEALAQTAKAWSFSYGDIEDFSNFTETKRFSQNYYGFYEFDVAGSNPHSWEYVKRIDPNWVRHITRIQ